MRYHFGIIGKPLKHSQSKLFFDARFAADGIDADYSIHELDAIEDVVPLLDLLDGLNVTSPYKEVIIPYLDSIDPVAQEMGAVNVVHNHRGYNTDWIGVTAALKPYLTPDDKHVLVLGSGGAAGAVRYALQHLGMDVKIVSRTAGKGDLTYADLTEQVMSTNRIIANCTPLGMFPNESETPDIPWDFVTDKHLLFDCIYNPEQTLFLQRGRQQGAHIVNGREMFLAQAEAAMKIFFQEE